MKKENIRLIKYFGVIFIAVLISYKLPHDSYSLIGYCIKPIKIQNSVIYLSGIVPLILIIIGLKGILAMEIFDKKNKAMIVLFMLLFIIPFMNWTLDFARTSYHTLKNDGINSLDVKKSNIFLESSNDSTVIDISLKMKDYSRHHNKFRIRVYLPKSLSEYTGKEYCECKNYYVTNGYNATLNVHEQISVDIKNADKLDEFLDTEWFHEDLKYELYNDNQTVKIIEHGNPFD